MERAAIRLSEGEIVAFCVNVALQRLSIADVAMRVGVDVDTVRAWQVEKADQVRRLIDLGQPKGTATIQASGDERATLQQLREENERLRKVIADLTRRLQAEQSGQPGSDRQIAERSKGE